MGINRNTAKSWSKDRIREELADLRRRITDLNEDANRTLAEADELVSAIDSGEHPSSYSSDPYKRTDAMSDYAYKCQGTAAELESDVEFLKSLL
ncbi:MAG: hypothetical protein K9N55_21020 [Phycisphaerae bacterium]|nr:hypothetical protein [Phycisphaerae bacterium]